MLKWCSIFILSLFISALSFQTLSKMMDWENTTVTLTLSEEEHQNHSSTFKAKENHLNWEDFLKRVSAESISKKNNFPEHKLYYAGPLLRSSTPPPDLL